MKNFPVTDAKTGKEYWVSRSIAVVIFLFAKNKEGNTCILTVQRGKGTPDPEFIGAYCAPCGYLDYDETCTEAALRELKEETGITLFSSDIRRVSILDNPKDDKRQNIRIIYVNNTYPYKALPSVEELEKQITSINSEKDEVSDIRFIDVKGLSFYKWAFNHNKLIKQYMHYV